VMPEKPRHSLRSDPPVSVMEGSLRGCAREAFRGERRASGKIA
jgi:hypothetical protein